MARTLKITVVGDPSSAERMFKKLGAAAGGFGSKVASAGKKAAIGLGVAGAAIGGIVGKLGIGFDAMREQAQIAFTTMLGDGKKASRFLDQLQAFAAKTPFEFQDVVRGSQRLLAMGFAAKSVIPTMTAIGDSVAAIGGSAQEIDQTTRALGQIQAKGRLMAEEMMQLNEAGTFSWRDLAREIGTSVPKAMQMVTKGQVKADKAIRAFTDNAKRRFKGMMDKQSQSLLGLWSTFKDVFSQISGSIMAPFFDLAKKGLEGVNKPLSDLAKRMSNAKGTRAKFEILLDFAQDTARSLGSKVQSAVSSAVASIDWNAAWNRAQGIGEGLAARLKSVNWSGVGASIGDGIASGVGAAASVGKKVADIVGQAVRNVDWNALGRAAGPGLAAAMVSALATLTDPSFWKKNWDLILAIGLSLFSGSVGRLAGKFAAPLVRMFGNVFLDVLSVVERYSPRIASFLLNQLSRLPGLVGGLLGRLAGLVGSLFGRMGRLARFTVKVLGIDVAIQFIVDFAHKVKEWLDRVIGWFKSLPGRITGAIGNISLTGIGSSIINSLWDGMKSKWETVRKWLGGVGGWIKSVKGPPAKDAVLLVENGKLIMGGLLRGLQSGWGDNEAFLSKAAGRLQAAMNRIQAQLDATQQRATDRSNQQALADAQKQLAEARKKGKGIADAERAVQDALQTIRDTAAQRQLDRLTQQHDKIIAKLQRLKEKAAAKLDQMRDKAGSAFDELAGKIQRAFQAKNDAFVSPAQAAIDAIMERRHQEDLQSAVADAQKALADAIENGGDVAAAQRALQRAQEDIVIDGKEKEAAIQQRAHDQLVEAQSEALDKMLSNLRTKLTEQGATWDEATQGILGIITSYDGGFEAAGTLLGQKFVEGLKAAMNAAAGASVNVKSASGKASTVTKAAARAGIQAMDVGGRILGDGLVYAHAGETMVPASVSKPYRDAGATVINVSMPNYLGDVNDAARAIRTELLRTGKQNRDIFGGY